MKTKIAAVVLIGLIACVQTQAQVSCDVIHISTLGDKAGSNVWSAQPQGHNTTDCCRNGKCLTCCQKSGRSCCCRSKEAAERKVNHSRCCCGLGCQKEKSAGSKCCCSGKLVSVSHCSCHGSTTYLPAQALASAGRSSPPSSNVVINQ